jgi:hypothetical protein
MPRSGEPDMVGEMAEPDGGHENTREEERDE